METTIVDMFKLSQFTNLPVYISRFYPADDWIDKHASGTLRKNKRLGFSWRKQYLEERICWEFGWYFKCIPKSRVRFGDALTEGDCKEITEAGWHMERYISRWPFIEDEFEVTSIEATLADGTIEKGIGLVVKKTSANWIPVGHLVYAIIVPEINETYLEARPL